MTDPLRSDRRAAEAEASERDRDARIEELLVEGLDHYFSERYELAINVWTRVLFIDRGHARARAYIERARSAAAERLRKGDELLHTGAAAFDRGDADAARQLIASAVDHGASRDEALALLARIERLEVAASQSGVPPRPMAKTAISRRDAIAAPDGRLRWVAAGLVAGAVLGAALLAVAVQRGIVPWPMSLRGEAVESSPLATPLPVPSIAELALARAEALHTRGRLHDALAALEPIAPGDPQRSRAQELKATIQRQLLAASRGQSPRTEGSARRP